MLVEVVHPEESTGMIHLQLPGQTMPYTDAPIFAQTSGYLKKWYLDIGAKVKAAEVLAEIVLYRLPNGFNSGSADFAAK
jgi:multidrug efflux pump subunit AcrA (membrane-fusion protein)